MSAPVPWGRWLIIIILVNGARLKVFFVLAVVVLGLTAWWWQWGSRCAQTVVEPIYQGDPDDKSVALTCNVFWGEEYVVPMLEILTEEQVRTTFFIGGTWAKKFPGLVREMTERGHEIGSHGYSHPHPDGLSREANRLEINKAGEILQDITGVKPSLFAPPYGERGAAVLQAAEESGYRTILWSIDTIDWQRPGAEVIINRVLTKAHNGGIVLMHPTEPTVQALPAIIEGLRERGFEMITVGEMLEREEDKNMAP